MSHDVKNLIETSTQPQASPVEVTAPQKIEKKRGKISLKTKVIASLAGLGVAGAGVAGFVASDNSKAEPREQGQGNEQVDPNNGQNPDDPLQPTTPETPDDAEDQMSPEAIAARLEIPSGLSAQALAEKIIEDMNLNINVGSQDPHLLEKMEEYMSQTGRIPGDDFINDYISPYHETFRETVFTDDVVFRDVDGKDLQGASWDAEENFSSFVLEGYMGTFMNESKPEPFRVEYNLVSVQELESEQPGTRVLIIEHGISHNADLMDGYITMINPGIYETTHYIRVTIESQSGLDKITTYEGYIPE